MSNMADNNMADAMSSRTSELETLSDAAAMMQRESIGEKHHCVAESSTEGVKVSEDTGDAEMFLKSEETLENLEERKAEEVVVEEQQSSDTGVSIGAIHSQVEVQVESDYAAVSEDASTVEQNQQGDESVTDVKIGENSAAVLGVSAKDKVLAVETSDHPCGDEERLQITHGDEGQNFLPESGVEESKSGEEWQCEEGRYEDKKITEMQRLGLQSSAEEVKTDSEKSLATMKSPEIPVEATAELDVLPTAAKRSHGTESEISKSDNDFEVKRKRVTEPEHNYSAQTAVSTQNTCASANPVQLSTDSSAPKQKVENTSSKGRPEKPVPAEEFSLTEHLFTIEVTTVSTVGNVPKPVTVTVLNVASVNFKCSKCSEPFKTQMTAAQMKFYKNHICQKPPPGKATPTSQSLRPGASPLNSPVTRSVAKTRVTVTPQTTPATSTPATSPHQTRGAVRRANQALASHVSVPVVYAPAVDASPKGTTPKQARAKQVARTSPPFKQEEKTEGSEEEKFKENEDDDDGETLTTRNQQLKFIKEQFYKARRRSLRQRTKRVGTGKAKSKDDGDTKASDTEQDVKVAKDDVGDDNDNGDGVHDADEINEGDDPSFDGDESKDGIDDDEGDEMEDDENESGPRRRSRKKNDFCIQCYLKLDHKCKMQVVTQNRKMNKTCNFCHKTYKTVNSLNQHMRAHTGERPYECKECGKSFRRSSTMFEHMRIHGGEKRYLCSVCGRKFLRKSDHTAHLRRHNNDFKYRCKECGKGFKGNAQLEVHMRKHTGEMPYLCTVCGRKFKHPFGLRVHMKYHEMAENPLKCTECENVYDDPDELRMHECSAGKQHMCSVCGKTFANPFAIKGHMKIHTRPNPSVCKSCQAKFPNEQELQKHQDEHIVKCSVCTKTIKEARSCMLNNLPGNPLKGKKFKCWKCHSAQTGAKALESPAAQPQERSRQPVVQSTQPSKSHPQSLLTKKVVTAVQPAKAPQIILTTPQLTEQVKPRMIQTSPAAISSIQSQQKDEPTSVISQPIQTLQAGHQVVAIQYNQPVHTATATDAMMPQIHQTIHVTSAPSHITQQAQLTQAIQSIQQSDAEQTTIMYHTQHQPSQTVYTTLTPQSQSADITGHYETQQLQQIQAYQQHHPQHIQHQQQQQQQQHSTQVHTIYHVQEEPIL